jgi:hypothetical protein
MSSGAALGLRTLDRGGRSPPQPSSLKGNSPGKRKPIHSLAASTARTWIRWCLRGPPCGFRIGCRLPHTLRNRRCAEPAIASSARAGASHRASLKAPPLQGRMTSFSPRAAPLFLRHDCDIMKCPAGPRVRECRGRGPVSPRAGPALAMIWCRLAREFRASIVSFLSVRRHRKSDGLRREGVVADRARRPAS